jgi:hypothetical protein
MISTGTEKILEPEQNLAVATNASNSDYLKDLTSILQAAERAKLSYAIYTYRQYLANFNSLLLHLLQDKAYGEELRLLMLPKIMYGKFDNLITKLVEYNSYLEKKALHASSDENQTVSLGNQTIDKIVKVTKVPAQDDESHIKKESLLNDLSELNEFIHSQACQDYFIQ